MEVTDLSVFWTQTHRLNSTFARGGGAAATPQHLILAQFLVSAVVFTVANLVFQRLHVPLGAARPPQGPSLWALVVEAHILRRKPEDVLRRCAARFGPVMHVRLWSQDMVVLSSAAAAEEFYKLHDAEFGARPSAMGRPTLANSFRDFWFLPRTAYWRHLRLVLDMTSSTPSPTRGIQWALEELHRHPEVVQRLRDELAANLEAHRQAEEADVAKLPYLRAVAKELFRLHPPSPFSFPHESSPHERCHIFGFEVPPRTQVFVNIAAVQRDPAAWGPNPHEFDPARFLSRPDVDVRGQHFQLVPFGAGRRQCPGTKLATLSVQLGLARYFQNAQASDDTSETRR